MGTFRVIARLRGNVSWRCVSKSNDKIMQSIPLNIENLSQDNMRNPMRNSQKMMASRIPRVTKLVYTGEVPIHKVQSYPS